MTYGFLSIIAPVVAVAGLAWLCAKRFEVPSCLAPLCAIGSIVTCLYISDFLSPMRITAVVLLVIGNVIFAFYLLRFIRDRGVPDTRRAILLVMLIAGLLGLYYLNLHAAFTQWDEFSHWGTFTKMVESEHTFHLKEEGIRYYFEDYPPGTALFSYFFLQGTGYQESVIYFAHSLILLAGCLPTIGMVLAVSFFRGLLAIVACYLLVVVLGQGWSSALIDQIVGILFGGVISGYWLLRNAPPSRLLALVPVLCFLVLSKQSGASFALLAALLILADRIWVMRLETGWRRKIAVVLPVAALWLVPRLIQASWNQHVVSEGISQSYGAANLGEAFLRLAGCCHTDRELATMASFFKAMTGMPEAHPSAPGSLLQIVIEQVFRLETLTSIWLGAGPSHFKILVLLCTLLIVSVFLQPRPLRARLALFGAAFVAAGFAYVLSLLVYYLYLFNEYEGRAITSHDRFINTYFLALGLFAIGVLLSVPAVTLAGRAMTAAAAVIFLFLMRSFATPGSYLMDGVPRITASRVAIREFLKPILSSTSKYSSVYAVWESTTLLQNGLEFWMMHYELRPRNTNHFCFSLGPPHYPEDVWSCKMNEQQVRDAFAGFQTVAVGNGLAVLRELYPDVFELAPSGQNAGIFETFSKANGELALRPFQPGLPGK
jgi:hypothetical protein